MNELQIFENEEFGSVRAIVVNNEPWFVARDICKALGLTNPTVAVQRLDDDERAKFNLGVHDSDGTNCVNEYGLYNMILASRKKEAQDFKRWITHEVIPSIRKHGGYIAGQDTLSDEELVAKALLVVQKQLEEREQVIKEQEELLIEQRPLVDFALQVSQSSDTVDMEEMAKIINDANISIGRNRLIKWLKANGIIKENRMPYQEYINRGYFDVAEVKKDTVCGAKVFPKTVVTGKGQVWLIGKLKEEYAAA